MVKYVILVKPTYFLHPFRFHFNTAQFYLVSNERPGAQLRQLTMQKVPSCSTCLHVFKIRWTPKVARVTQREKKSNKV